MDYDQPKENTPTVTSSLYGTLPRRGKRSRRTQKKTPEEMAILLAQYAVYQAEKVNLKNKAVRRLTPWTTRHLPSLDHR